MSEYFPLKHFHVYMVLLYSSVVVVVEVVDVIVFVLLFGLRGLLYLFCVIEDDLMGEATL